MEKCILCKDCLFNYYSTLVLCLQLICILHGKLFKGEMIVVSIYLLPDRILYTINTTTQTRTARRAKITPKTEATAGTKGEVDLGLPAVPSSGMLLLLTPKLDNNYMNYR